MTEFPTTTMNNTQAPLQHRSNTDGHVADGVEVQAVSSQHQMVPWGQPGELRVRGPERMIGYVDPGLNSEVCDADGWLYTGDVGYVDASRDVVITGRIKDIINRGGEKFAARDIEDALSTHPAVAEVAVIGIPGGRLGERVCAVAVLRPGMKPTPADLVSYLDACRIAKQKIPEEIRFVDRLPRTAFGKIQKFKIIDDW
jgi:acyl-CoA synthetase